MSQSAKATEPSMEEILASIRRIIADDDTGKAPAKPAAPPAPPPRPAPPPPPPPRAAASPPPPRPAPRPTPAPSMNQNEVDSMLSSLDAPPGRDGHRDDVLDLTESMTAPSSMGPGFQTIDGQPDVIFSDAPAEQAPAPRVIDEARRQFAQNNTQQPSGLLSNSTSAAVDSAFNALAQTVLVQNARTLEDLVREMLRPMLKAWLDDNLPGMVERIVKAEIERVSRGRS